MKLTHKTTSVLRLNQFKKSLIDAHNDADIKFPLEVVLVSDDAATYTHKNEHFIDYSPETLGYYWINKNKCLRTGKGLIFKTSTKNDAVQTLVKKDKTIVYQNIDWQKSIRPSEEKEYAFEKITGLKTILNKSSTNEWHLEIEGKKVGILNYDLEFSYEYNQETGFKLINNAISYYNRPLSGVDINSFKVLNCNYAIDKNNAFCGNDALPNVDITTFKALTYDLAKDKNHVYHGSNILRYADTKSLQLFDNHTSLFFKDKNHVFIGETIVVDADLQTFRPIGEIFGTDKNHVYRFEKPLQQVDVNSFEIINDAYFKDKNNIYRNSWGDKIKVCKNDGSFNDLGEGYYKLNNTIYHHNCDDENKKISDDYLHFRTLSFQWAKDKTSLFYNGKKIYKGDVYGAKILDDGFHVITSNKVFFYGDEYMIIEEIKNVDTTTFTAFSLGLSKDKNHLYFMGKKVKNALPDSFEQLDKNNFKDKNNFYSVNNLFYELLRIKNIDTSTIEILPAGYIKNKEAVYCDKSKITGADPNSFEVLKVNGHYLAYSRDKNSIYYLNKELHKLSTKKFKLVNHQFIHDDKIVFYEDVKLNLNAKHCVFMADDYVKDQNNVYYRKFLIKEADAESFEIINSWFQKDKNRLFHQTIPLELNPDTVKIKEQTYAYDEQHAYFSNHKIKGVDMASFQVLEYNFSKDKYHVFHQEKCLKEVDAPSFRVMGYSVFQDKNNIYTFKQGEFVVERKR